MSASANPAAPHHLPFFITAPGETDMLMVTMLVILLAAVVLLGNLYFKLHALPERMAHRNHNSQMQLVAVLTLLALFTHNQIFWVAALLLVVVKLPDFSSPISSIARSLEKLTGSGGPPVVPAPAISTPPIEGERIIAERVVDERAVAAVPAILVRAPRRDQPEQGADHA